MILSIMMPFYGDFNYFKQAVNSVLAQKDPNWQLTIIDDHYPDAAPGNWARAIKDPRVTYLRNATNLRPSRNYNKAVELTRTDFIVIMGCDDIMLPSYVESVRRLIEYFPDADIIQPGVSVIDENSAPSRPLPDIAKSVYRFSGKGARSYTGETLAISLLRGNWTYFPSLAWRVQRLATFGFRTDLDVVQDLAMLMEITKAGGSLVLDDQVVFNYRRHSTSVSAVTGPDGSKFQQERVLFDECVEACRALGWTRAARAARNHISSRINALSELPGALVRRDRGGINTLSKHVFNRARATTKT